VDSNGFVLETNERKDRDMHTFPTAPSPTTTHLMVCISLKFFREIRYYYSSGCGGGLSIRGEKKGEVRR